MYLLRQPLLPQTSSVSTTVVPHNTNRAKKFRLFLTILGHVIVDSILKCCAWPIMITVLFGPALEALSLGARLAVLLSPLAVFLPASLTLQYFLIGARSDGKADASLKRLSQAPQDGSLQSKLRIPLLILTLFATGTEILDGALAGLAFEPQLDFSTHPGSAVIAVVLAVGLGIGKALSFLMIGAQGAWRKAGEYYELRPIAEQPPFKPFYLKSRVLGHLLREVFPLLMGGLQALCIYQAVKGLLVGVTSLAILAPVWALTGISMVLGYLGAAMVTQGFDVQQMVQTLAAEKKKIPAHPFLTRLSPFQSPKVTNFVYTLGGIISGLVLFDVVHKVCKQAQRAARITVGIACFFNAIGLLALAWRGLTEYIVSDNAAQIAAGAEGILLRFFVGAPAAASIGGAYFVASAAKLLLGGLLGAMQSYAKAATGRVYLVGQPTPSTGTVPINEEADTTTEDRAQVAADEPYVSRNKGASFKIACRHLLARTIFNRCRKSGTEGSENSDSPVALLAV